MQGRLLGTRARPPAPGSARRHLLAAGKGRWLFPEWTQRFQLVDRHGPLGAWLPRGDMEGPKGNLKWRNGGGHQELSQEWQCDRPVKGNQQSQHPDLLPGPLSPPSQHTFVHKHMGNRGERSLAWADTVHLGPRPAARSSPAVPEPTRTPPTRGRV